jgi:branched-chain amino acid transport system ATP-binding protein
VLGRFPILAERINQAAGTLSGGEQQMLVIGRALMSRP